MLKKLTQIWGVSGLETQVSDFIISEVIDMADEVKRDAIGNVIALKKGCGENKKKIMVAAHMDEIGLSVMKVLDNGFLQMKKVGGVSPYISYMNRIKFENGTMGTIACMEKIQNIQPNDIIKLYVDIGAANKEEALQYVKPGDCAAFCGEYVELAGRNVMSKAFDDRAACYILIEALKAMKTPYHDVYFVFTVQEEVGLGGSKTSAERIKPDLGIAVDITGSFDVPEECHGTPVLGKGAAIKVSDGGVICDAGLIKDMVACAEANNITYQYDILAAGVTDVGAINKSNEGVKALGISIPTRYGHSPNSIVNLDDVQACIDLLKAFVEKETNIVTEEVFK